MAIRMRRGLEADFDAEKMVPGEWAVSTDTRYVRMCFAPGICLRMATYEAFEADMQEIQNILATCQDIQKAVEKFEGLAEQNAATAQSYSIESKSWSDSAKSYSEEATRQANLAKTYAEKASEVTEIDYATQDRAGIIKGGENHIAEDGTLELTKRTTDRTLSNSYAGGIKINEVQGKSEQGSTTGKNLLNCSGLTEQTINGVTFTPVYENGMLQYINVNGTATGTADYRMKSSKEASFEAGTYRINGCPEGGGSTSYSLYIDLFKDGTSNTYAVLFDFGSGPSFEWEENTSLLSICIRIANGATLNNLKFYPMIRLATIEDSTYEPYTGGIPSPNPDYPQDIKSVEAGEIKNVGKNLFDKETVNNYTWLDISTGDLVSGQTGYYTSDYIPVSANTSYYIPNKGSSRCWIYNADKSPNKYIENSGGILTPDVNGFIRITASYTTVSVDDLQLEEGDTATPYVPYTESKITLSSPITLRGIVDVKDRIVRKDNVWGIERNVAEIASYNGESITTEYISTTGGLDTGATVDYVLSATTFEPLPEADQKAFHTLQSFDTVTYISTDSEVEPVIDLEYGTSRVGGYTLETWNNAENNKIMLEELTTAMLVMNQE